MQIRVKYSVYGDTITVSSFEEIEDHVVYVDCSWNQLKSLPKNIGCNWTNLTHFDCYSNQLTSLPENIGETWTNLMIFNCGNNQLISIPENIGINWTNLIHFYCSNNKLTSLPENIGENWTNLTQFYCSLNKLKSLPENIGSNWTNLTQFYCSYNELISLPENIGSNWTNLSHFNCFANYLELLPENIGENWTNVTHFSCNNNQLTLLPENIGETWTNLTHFDCYSNQLTSLPENISENWTNLTHFNCHNNQLNSLPLSLMNCHNLRNILYYGNEIDNLPIQLMRFINRIRQVNTNGLNIYNDNQNVHNSNIQLSIKQSIENITTRTDLPEFDKDKLITIIVDDKVLNCKEQLIEYINDDSIHSLLLLTFGEVLWYVLMTIKKDFSVEEQEEIKKILNTDMSDALCKCFTGRISRVVNCLSGFSPLVNIQIKDESQIGNIIVIIKEQLGDEYSVEKHKKLVYKELVERGFDIDTINEWLEYIE
jgi:Leucine-rich repeat (LRR) protein